MTLCYKEQAVCGIVSENCNLSYLPNRDSIRFFPKEGFLGVDVSDKWSKSRSTWDIVNTPHP